MSRIFYGIDGYSDQYTLYDNADDLIRDYLDDTEKEPETVVVTEYERMRVLLTESDILDPVLEMLNSHYGDPRGFYRPGITDGIKMAISNLVEVLEKEYEPWVCLETGKKFMVYIDEWTEKENKLDADS